MIIVEQEEAHDHVMERRIFDLSKVGSNSGRTGSALTGRFQSNFKSDT